MLILTFHRIVLFAVGLTIFTQSVSIIPGWIGLNKPITALLGVSTALLLATRSIRIPRSGLHFWVAAFLFSISLGFAISLVYRAPMELLLRVGQSYILVIAFYFLLIVAIQSMSDLRTMLWGVLAGALVTSASVVAGLGGAETDALSRTGGLAKDPNYYAMGAGISIAIAIFLGISSERWSTRALLTGAAAFMLGGLVLSLSRGGYVAFAAMTLLFLFRYLPAQRLSLLVPVLIVAAVAPLMLPESVVERVTVFRREGVLDNSIQNRIQQYQRSVEMFTSSPVWGVGLGRSSVSEAFGGAIERQDLRALAAGAAGYSVIHSSYLTVAAEFGLLGLIPYLGLLLFAWLGFSRVIRSQRYAGTDPPREYRMLVQASTMMQIAMLGALVASLFLNATRFKAMWLILAMSPVFVSMLAAHFAPAAEAEEVDALDAGLTPESSPVA